MYLSDVPLSLCCEGKALAAARQSGCVLPLEIFHLDPVDIDDTSTDSNPALQSIGFTLVDRSNPPTDAGIVAQD